MNNKEQLLQIFRSFYFKIKCNNNKNKINDFFLPKSCSAFKVHRILIGLWDFVVGKRE